MAYQMYRNTTLGITLQETLDELVQNGTITATLAMKVMTQFDKVINKALAHRARNRIQFKAEHLKTYRFCDNVWTFVMEGVEFRDMQEHLNADKVKFVACDAKMGSGNSAPAATSST